VNVAYSEDGSIVEEPLSRFIFDSDKVNQAGRVKDGAFLPSVGANDRLETSICRIEELHPDTIWEIGRSTRPDRSLKGRADFSAETVIAQGLRTVPDTEGTFIQHAVILGWPTDKVDQKLLAREIAKASRGLIVP
jgi:hypothetical protein